MLDLTQAITVKDWLSLDSDKMEATMSRVPERDEIDPLVNEQLIVELYSR
jgi:small subunit ribosomal protein S4